MIVCKRFHLGILWCILSLGAACSSDDMILKEDLKDFDVTLIGEDLNSVYQYDYAHATREGVQSNLSREMGISNSYLTLRQLDKTVSFFTFSNNAISLFQKDLVTEAVATYPEFYNITSERSLVWGMTNEDSVYFGLYKPFGSTNLALRVVGLSNFEGIDVSLEFAIDQLFEPIYSNGTLFISYRTGSGNHKIVAYDTDAAAIHKTFNFGRVKPSVLITDKGNLAVFTQNENENTFLELFDGANLKSLTKMELEFDQPFATGPINGALVGDNLYYQYTYPQPYEISKGPAIFNSTTGSNRVLDILGIIHNLEEAIGMEVQPIHGQYLKAIDLFAISYSLPNGTESEIGGFILISTDGNLLVQRNLNFVPTYFVE